MAMTKALVIGGNGFLGAHLVDMLAQQGYEVSVFDRFSRGVSFFKSPDVRILKGDFSNRDALRSAVNAQDEVFHFLSATTPASAKSPTSDVKANVLQSIDLFAACAEAGVRRVYFASSGGAIYGAAGDGPISEETVAAPISPYAISKLSLEGYLNYFEAEFGLQHRILRISNPYGEGQSPTKPQGLIPIVLRQILRGEPITKLGDGSMVRDYIYIQDLMRQIQALITLDTKHRIYNLGSGVGHSVSQVLEIAKIVTGRDFQIQTRSQSPTYVSRVVLDVNRLHSEIGARTYTSLDEGIAKTWHSIVRES